MDGRRAVAGVAAFLAVAAGLLALAGPVTGQLGSPSPATPFPAVPCDVAPRTVQELAAIAASATPLPDTYPLTIYIGEPPRGVPPDAQTVAGVTRTVQLLIACCLAGDELRLAALFTDDSLRLVTAGADAASLMVLATPSPSPNQDEYLAAVEQVQLLADGRVSALVTRGGVEDGHPAPGRTALMFFRREGGRWLIDGIYEKIWPTPGALPTPAADLRPTPAGATLVPTPAA